jgi:uncharacterized protein (DUF885 family)
MASITEISERYVDEMAQLDPVRAAGSMGVGRDLHHVTDYSPAGHAARTDVLRKTAAGLRATEPANEAERLGRLFLLDRIVGEQGLHEADESQGLVSAIVGPTAALRSSFDLLTTDTDEDWERIADRLDGVPASLAGYRQSLDQAAWRGVLATRSVVETTAAQCRTWGAGAGWFATYVAPYRQRAGANAALAVRLDAAAAAAGRAYGELGDWLGTEHARRAAEQPGVGEARYRRWLRSNLGAAPDLDETYEWGWAELGRIEAEKALECEQILPGEGFEAVRDLLSTDPAYAIEGVDAWRQWLQDVSDDATARLNGTQFDIPDVLLRCDIGIPPEGSAAAPYYTPPTEDLSEPGRTWFPALGRTMFATWDDVTTCYHEAVPGHHLQIGGTRLAPLIRAHRLGFHNAHGEGWALYAERLMDELGFFDTPHTRLGFLSSQGFRAVRVVVDIGLHTHRRIPAGWAGAGEVWTPALAVEALQRAGGLTRTFAESEVQRYLSWPGQATTYKLGERTWLESREAARAAAGPDFDLKAWHAMALALGALGLADLARELTRSA